MTSTPPVAIFAAPSNVTPPDANKQTPEPHLFDYAIEAERTALSHGGRLANPATLMGDVVEGLRGFFDRARRMSRDLKGLKSSEPPDVSDVSLFAAQGLRSGELHSTLHRGPAQESLEPIGSDFDRPDPEETGDPHEIAEQLVDQLMNSALVQAEATVIGSVTSHVSTSVNTLLRGQ
jgi:hypothetical protein